MTFRSLPREPYLWPRPLHIPFALVEDQGAPRVHLQSEMSAADVYWASDENHLSGISFSIVSVAIAMQHTQPSFFGATPENAALPGPHRARRPNQPPAVQTLGVALQLHHTRATFLLPSPATQPALPLRLIETPPIFSSRHWKSKRKMKCPTCAGYQISLPVE